MTVELQASLALIHGMTGLRARQEPDAYGREPFRHVALDGLSALTEENKRIALNPKKIAALGNRCGLQGVLRWKPRTVGS